MHPALENHSEGKRQALLFGLGRRRAGCRRGEQAETIPEILALHCQSVVPIGWQDLLPVGSSVCLWSQHLPGAGMGLAGLLPAQLQPISPAVLRLQNASAASVQALMAPLSMLSCSFTFLLPRAAASSLHFHKKESCSKTR